MDPCDGLDVREALVDSIAKDKQVIAFRKQTREVEEKLKRHNHVTLLIKNCGLLEQQSRFQQMIRDKVVRIETLHFQPQEKERIVVKSRIVIQQRMFKVDESKNKEQLESQIIILQNDLSQTTVENEGEARLKDQSQRAINRILEIINQEREIHNQKN